MMSYGIVGASSVHNSDTEACLLVAEEQGHGGSGVVGQEVALSVSNWKVKEKRLPRKGRQLARAVVNDQMKNRLERNLQRSVFGWKIKGKRSQREEKWVPRAWVGDKMKNILEERWKRIKHNEQVEDNDDTNLKDDDNTRALVVYGEKREISVTPSVSSGLHHKQPGDHIAARSKVRELLQLYRAMYRKLTQVKEQGNPIVGRIYLEAAKAVKKDPIYAKPGAIVGNIPGVEVGDEFYYRIELAIVGLHRLHQGGIDTSKVNGVPVAISVVASGGYPDELSSSGELIYTGSGGKAGGNKDEDDQKLERGNLALKNCIKTKTPVRVIHGFNGQNISEFCKETSIFTYDGLYEVVECWQEFPKGKMVFKYKLHRIAGQPELTLHAVKAIRTKIREGLCFTDISRGMCHQHNW